MDRCMAANEKVKVRNQIHIPNDLSFSILSKLPIKSLKRFGCVHKSWSMLFDNPIFMTTYRNHFLTKDHSYYDDTSILLHQTFCPWDGYYSDETYELYSVSGERFENRIKLDWPSVKLDPINRLKTEYDSGFNILGSGSVRGTLCLFCASRRNIILWNPSTEEFKLIPPSPIDSGHNWVVHVDHHEFGYDHVKDDYKVMRHIAHRQRTNIDLEVQPEEDISSICSIWEIYSLRNNSWRQLDFEMHNKYIDYCGQLYMDGLSHWLCRSETHDEIYLCSFDWSNYVFLTTDTNYSFDCFLGWLVLLNGSVALILNHTETATFHISILGELGVMESWTKLFIVGPLPCLEYPIGTGNKGDLFFQKKDRGLVWFNLNTQKTEDLVSEGFDRKIVIHKENLLPFLGKNT